MKSLRKHPRGVKEKYEVDLESGCWIWEGALNSDGYGYVRDETDGQKFKKALRYFWEKKWGTRLTKDQELDHSCRRRRCVNPDHGVIKSRWGNMASQWDIESEIARLTKEQRQAIVEAAVLDDEPFSQIAERHMVGRQTVRYVVRHYELGQFDMLEEAPF